MSPIRRKPDPARQAQFLAEIQKNQAQRAQGYRERALAMFPHVCARCERSFEGKTLRELTVHHKDHNHSNNPPDGSNWELLCLYCHDYEHELHPESGYGGNTTQERHSDPSLENRPFAGLEGLLKPKDEG